MTDSTRPRPGPVIVAVACLVLVLLSVLGTAGRALADGDPASDVLATQTLFLPQDGDIPAAQQSQLASIVATARQAGYPVRVALIATAADLGSVTALWHRPQSYAEFLGQELSQVFTGTLLVVMPNGYGVSRLGGAASARFSGSADAAALHGVRPPGSGAGLGSAGVTAVQRLAAVSGHRLDTPTGAVLRARAGSASGADLTAWIAVLAGAVLIAAAWAASLRVRPLRQPDGVASSHGS